MVRLVGAIVGFFFMFAVMVVVGVGLGLLFLAAIPVRMVDARKRARAPLAIYQPPWVLQFLTDADRWWLRAMGWQG